MLKKLIKHEFIATWRSFIPLYIGLTIATFAAMGFIALSDKLDGTLLMLGSGFGILIGILAMIFAFVAPYIFIAMRFYKTTATREAYLTFTVPADTKAIIFSKLLVAFLWTLLTFLLAGGAILAVGSVGSGQNAFEVIGVLMDKNSLGMNTLQIISLLLGTLNSVISIFTAVALGQIVRDHRVIASIAFYVAIYTVQQIASVVITLPFMLANIETANSSMEFSIASAEATSAGEMPVILLSLGFSVVFIAVQLFLSNFLLKKKLNLL